MRRHHLMLGQALAIATVAVLLPRIGFAQKPAVPDLNGAWLYDEVHSEDPQQKLMEMRRQQASAAGGGFGGGGSGTGGASGAGGDGGDSRLPTAGGADDLPTGAAAGAGGGQRPAGGNRPSGQVPQRLVIEQDADHLSIGYPDGRKREFVLGDAKGPMTGRWRKDRLVLTQEMPDGKKLSQRLELDDQGNLVIATTLPPRDGMPGFTYKQVYGPEP